MEWGAECGPPGDFGTCFIVVCMLNTISTHLMLLYHHEITMLCPFLFSMVNRRRPILMGLIYHSLT